METGTSDRPASNTEQRRASRFRVVVPVEVKWLEANGRNCAEAAEAKEVNALGGLLSMKTQPRIGSELEVTNRLSNEVTRARVAAIRRSKAGAVLGVAIELLAPSETFWGVNFQLKKTSAELAKIEEVIRSGGVDSRILREFRDAVDYVRKTACAVQEWQERQVKKHDPQTVLPLIIYERIRRATQISHLILSDLETHDITADTVGIEEYSRAIQSLHEKLASLIKSS